MKDLGVQPVREYIGILVDGGTHLYACKFSVDRMELTKDDFVPGVEDIVTASDFMDMTEGGDIFYHQEIPLRRKQWTTSRTHNSFCGMIR